ncbi:MAG: hypothetical protein QOF18_1913 [Frankiaceae bacterium]|jgi:hypothetical protein|nr:hypothetical protein [Frankiaceae bacterium]
MRRISAVCAVVVLGATIGLPAWGGDNLLPGVTLTVHRGSNGAWTRTSSPSPGGQAALYGVLALARTNVWAVGGRGRSQNEKPLVEHWNGAKWVVVASPAVAGGSWLRGVDGVSAHDVWAVGSLGGNAALIEHWNGSAWSVSQIPATPNAELDAVDALAANDVWAVGSRNGKTFTEHYDGTWHVVASPSRPGQNVLTGVAAVGPSDVWAVGGACCNNHPGTTLVEHWNGTKWSLVSSLNVGNQGSGLQAVSASSAKNVTAVGDYLDGRGCLQTLVLQWNGSAWKRQSSPNAGPCDAQLLGVVRDGSNVWAVGQHVTSTHGTSSGFVLTHGANGWKIAKSFATAKHFNELVGVDVVPRSKNVWAVGLGTNDAAV